MIRPISLSVLLTGALAVVAPATAATVDLSQDAGGYRIDLKVLPLEPIYTAQQVGADHIKSGLLVVSGAKPMAVNAQSHPNHRLVVSVVDEKTGRPDSDADVGLFIQPFDRQGGPTTNLVRVPVAKIQEIGEGPASTQYGNNVELDSGRYRISVTVKGMDLTYFASV